MKRQIRIEGSIAYVPLTQGYEAVIDAADVPLVAGFNWQAQIANNSVYAIRTARQGGKRRDVLMHRYICATADGEKVDHRDGNGLNNCRANLRPATVAQNNRNRRRSSANTSGFKGVSLSKKAGKWRAVIEVQGRQESLGYFASPEAAHAAYVAAAQRHYGEFACAG